MAVQIAAIRKKGKLSGIARPFILAGFFVSDFGYQAILTQVPLGRPVVRFGLWLVSHRWQAGITHPESRLRGFCQRRVRERCSLR